MDVCMRDRKRKEKKACLLTELSLRHWKDQFPPSPKSDGNKKSVSMLLGSFFSDLKIGRFNTDKITLYVYMLPEIT